MESPKKQKKQPIPSQQPKENKQPNYNVLKERNTINTAAIRLDPLNLSEIY